VSTQVEAVGAEPAGRPRRAEKTVPLKVVVVAGTRVRAQQLERILTAPDLVVAGGAKNAGEAEELVEDQRPAAVLVDLDLHAGGLEVIERIMATRATPIVVCGPAADRPEVALAAGAVDVVGALDAPAGSPEYAAGLIKHLRVAARVKVITHPRARLRPPPPGLAPGDDGAPKRMPIVAIGASTGGPPALATVLAEFPADMQAAIIVVQHMAEGFVEGLGRWLDDTCPLPVVVACDGERLRSGVVHLAPANKNLLIQPGLRVRLEPPYEGQFHLPGVDLTFRSVATVAGPRAVGALLTGMGRDGAEGLLAMRKAGAFTIGQDEESSVVWGMPQAAQQLDAVDVELPLPEIAQSIVSAARRVQNHVGDKW
jgi:two-component system chemotaxis response regulator CheB